MYLRRAGGARNSADNAADAVHHGRRRSQCAGQAECAGGAAAEDGPERRARQGARGQNARCGRGSNPECRASGVSRCPPEIQRADARLSGEVPSPARRGRDKSAVAASASSTSSIRRDVLDLRKQLGGPVTQNRLTSNGGASGGDANPNGGDASPNDGGASPSDGRARGPPRAS